jgi:predicted metal-binding membrane protein
VTVNVGRARLAFERIGWRAPQWWVGALVPMAWLLAISATWTSVTAAEPSSHHLHASLARPAATDGLVTFACVVAMMVPLVLPTLRRVAVASLWTRRDRAIAVCLTGYLASWLVASIVIGLGVDAAHAGGGPFAAIGISAAAALAWQGTRAKRRALRACHITRPLSPSGWTADRDCAALGLKVGWSCVRNCWALMALVFAFGHHPIAMFGVFLVTVLERFGRRTFFDVARGFIAEVRFALSPVLAR